MKALSLALTASQIEMLSDDGKLNPNDLRSTLNGFVEYDSYREDYGYTMSERDYTQLDSKTFKHTVKVADSVFDRLSAVAERDNVTLTQLTNWIFEYYYPVDIKERLFYADVDIKERLFYEDEG